MSGYGVGIRRGAMAGDRFTQISNALFRDPRISFKAKGLFGLISTHRDGWRVTVAELAKCSTDGRDAVSSGLKELATYGYLVRERARNEDGTLGEAVYAITDMPAHLYDLLGDAAPGAVVPQTRRSQPMTGNPALDNPAQADPVPKKTKRKKTNQQNTNSVHPSVRTAPACEAEVAPDPVDPPAVPAVMEASPGVHFLLGLGTRYPELLLTGAALQDQGAVVTALLDGGWSPGHLQHVIAGRPLPHPVRTSVGAIVAARLRSAQSTPPPPPRPPTGWGVEGPAPTPRPADRTPREALAHRALVECAGCGTPGPVPGEDLCPACLNWPLCTTCKGPTPRRAHPDGDGRCAPCTTAAAPPWDRPAASGI